MNLWDYAEMTTTRTWYHRLSQWWKPNGVPESNSAEPVQVGIIEAGDRFLIVSPYSTARGVKLVSVPAALISRAMSAEAEMKSVREIILTYPQSLRPRRRKPAAKVEIPDLNEATQSTETSA